MHGITVFKDKIKKIKKDIEDAFLSNNIPWVIAYSGGKDSTLTLQLTLEVLENIKNPKKEVHILYADTKVEPPPVIGNAKRLLEKVNKWALDKKMPVKTAILYPELKDRFFVLMLGKGYLPPTKWFRWCTERLKIRPVKKYIRNLIKEYGSCVVLLGMRLKESSTRDAGLKKRGYSKWMPFEGLKGAMIYAPILELSIEEVWSYLLDNEPPWGMDNLFLRTLYTAGNTSCSLFCGGIRFGCWVCTVVKKDRCTEGLSELPGWDRLEYFLAYRDLMLLVREDSKNRILKNKNGKPYLGPLNLDARKFLYNQLKELEKLIGIKILNNDEEKLIKAIWEKEQKS